MKGLFGVLAGLVGLPLLCIGGFGMMGACMMSHSEPEFSSGLTMYGMMALLFGSILCWAAWKHAKEENVCPKCRCWLADGVKTCKYCETDVK